MNHKLKGFFVFLVLIIFVTFYYTIGYFFNKKEFLIQAYTLQTQIDVILPLIPIFILVYFSMYILAIVPCFYIHKKRNFTKLVFAYLLTLLTSFLLFTLFPVKMLRPEIIATSLMEKLVAFLYQVDTPYNNFPSLHVALSFLAYFYVWKYYKKHSIFILIWAILVVFSTLFIKQHYFLDTIAGVLIAIVVFLIFERRFTTKKQRKSL